MSEESAVEEEIRSVKKLMRPEAANTEAAWQPLNYFETFDTSLTAFQETGNISRIHISEWTARDFVEKFEERNTIAMIYGAQDDWQAKTEWTLDKLADRFPTDEFKVGVDPDGYDVHMTMRAFAHYATTTKDDIPLYVFDQFGSDPVKSSLLKDYKIPHLFTEDLFKFLEYDEHGRPPFRWFVVGSARSGTGMHVDPLDTSAWNALISGHKFWVLFPPATPQEMLKEESKSESNGVYGNEAVPWFTSIYPKTQLPSWPEEFKPIQVLQGPGDTIFVPGSWHHIVLNLDLTIAVTQNFVSRTNFPNVWIETMKFRPELIPIWLDALWVEIPSLARLGTLLSVGHAVENEELENENPDVEENDDADDAEGFDEREPMSSNTETEFEESEGGNYELDQDSSYLTLNKCFTSEPHDLFWETCSEQARFCHFIWGREL